jgi:hypothetical protein
MAKVADRSFLLQQEHASIGEIVHVEKFAKRRSGATHRNRRCISYICFMEPPNWGGQPIQIGWHGRDVIVSKLGAGGLAHF